MRCRSSAALWMGKMSGPNLSRSFVRLQAGWYGDSLYSGGASEVPSDADRVRLWPLGARGGPEGVSENVTREVGTVGVLGVRGSTRLSSSALVLIQYFSRRAVLPRSWASCL